MGFRMDGTRNGRADWSAAETSGGGILPICPEPDVRGVLRGLAGFVGGLWAGEPGRDRGGVRRRAGHSFVCAALRGANVAKDVRRAIRRILQECSAGGPAYAHLEPVSGFERTQLSFFRFFLQT